MKIYIVLWEDRHTDTTATPFLDLQEAKKWAYEQAQLACRYMEDFEVSEIDGWEYYVRYSEEGGSIWITEHQIQ